MSRIKKFRASSKYLWNSYPKGLLRCNSCHLCFKRVYGLILKVKRVISDGKGAVVVLKEIIKKCSGLDIYQKRSTADDYVEIVFYSKDLDEWNKILTEILGNAVKPVRKRPSKDDLLLAKNYGGILKNQTLFRKDFDNITVAAMFWPWQDGKHTTLKVFSISK